MVRIRRADVSDSARIAAVHVRTWQAAYADVLPAGYLASFDPTEWAARRRRHLAGRTPPAEVFVAVRLHRRRELAYAAGRTGL